MSIELILTTFDDDLPDPSDPVNLTLLGDSLRSIVRKLDGDEENIEVSEEEISVHLPGGTAVIQPNYANFPIEELDPLTLGVIYKMANFPTC